MDLELQAGGGRGALDQPLSLRGEPSGQISCWVSGSIFVRKWPSVFYGKNFSGNPLRPRSPLEDF
jgi:hypothetical protein